MKITKTVPALLFCSLCLQPAYADHAVTRWIIEDTERLAQAGEKPVIIFDLDDTLFDTRYRSVRILHQLAMNPEFNHSYPMEAAQLKKIAVPDIQYSIEETVRSVGISQDPVIHKIKNFWVTHYFSNEGCANDVPIPGAQAFLHAVSQAGGQIVYLTGRDRPRMETGTLASLRRSGFPTGPFTRLIMKEHHSQPDLDYKKAALNSIDQMGRVTAAFENEPRNLNTMAERFPDAWMVFLETIHSAGPETPVARAHVLKDYFFSNFLSFRTHFASRKTTNATKINSNPDPSTRP